MSFRTAQHLVFVILASFVAAACGPLDEETRKPETQVTVNAIAPTQSAPGRSPSGTVNEGSPINFFGDIIEQGDDGVSTASWTFGAVAVPASDIVCADTAGGVNICAPQLGDSVNGNFNANSNGVVFRDNGMFTAVLRSCDEDPITTNCTFSNVIVDIANVAPVANAESYNTDEDTTLNGSTVLANDTDAGALDTLTAVLVAGPGVGSLTLNADGTFTYVPAANANGTYTFTYQAQDDDGALSAAATVTLVVNAVNDTPTVANQIPNQFAAEDDADAIVDLSTTFADSDIATNADSLTLTVAGNTNTSLVGTAISGTNLTLDFQLDQNGSADITVRATDSMGDFVEDTFTLTVSAVNDTPTVANAISDVSVTEDAANDVLDLSATFADVDIATNADNLTLSVFGNTNPTLVSAAILGTSLTLDYGANQNGTATITVRATDSLGAFVDDAFTVTVTAENDAPTVANATADVTVLEDAGDTVLDLSSTFADVDIATNADSLDLSVISNTNPALVSSTLSGSNLTLDYAANQNGVATITVRATDAAGAFVEDVFDVNVTAVNDVPVANTDFYATPEDTALVTVFATQPADAFQGTEVEVANSDDTCQGVTLPFGIPFANGAPQNVIRICSNGNVQFGSGDAEYSNQSLPYSGFAGAAVVYWDDLFPPGGNGVFWEVQGTAGTRRLIVEWQALPYCCSSGDPITVRATFFEASSNIEMLYVNVDDANPSFNNGAGATIGVQIDGATATQFSFNEANNVFNGRRLIWTMGATSYVAAVAPASGVFANDSDVDSAPATWAASLVSGPSNGSLTLNLDGSFTYTPAADFVGLDSFTYEFTDGGTPAPNLTSNVTTVSINVTAVNDAPVANADAYAVNEDDTLNVAVAAGVLDNDTDTESAQATWSAVVVSSTTNGSLTLNGDGSFDYVPNANFNGTDTFTYEFTDGGVGTPGQLESNVATVTITVNAVNDAPVASADSYSTNEDIALVVPALTGVLANDSDLESATATWSAAVVSSTTNGSLTLNANGSFTYTPDPNYFGSDSFTYRFTDGGVGAPGNLDSNTVTVSLSVAAVNDRPSVVINTAPATVAEGTGASVNVTISEPASDTASALYRLDWDFGDGFTATSCVASLGSYSSPSHAYADDDGSPRTFTVTVTDEQDAGCTDSVASLSNSPAVTTSIAVTNVAPAVSAGGDQTVNEGAIVSLDPATFVDPGTGDTHTATIHWGDNALPPISALVTQSAGSGAVSASHQYADNGTYTVTVTVSDDDGGSNSDIIEVTVDNVTPLVDAGTPLAVLEGAAVCTTGANFADAGTNDSHSGSGTGIFWGEVSGVVAGPYYNPVNGSVYLVASGADYADLRQRAVALGGDLATITDIGENDYLRDNVRALVPFHLTIGLNDVAAENDFVWADGTPHVDGLDFANWETLEPNNSGDEDAVQMYANGFWNDTSALGAQFGIVEIDTADQALEPFLVTVNETTSPDGSTSPLIGTISNACYTYRDNGTYTITLGVADDDGAYATDTTSVVVSNVPPVASFNTPTLTVDEGSLTTYNGSVSDAAANDDDAPFDVEWDFVCVDTAPADGECDPATFAADLTSTESAEGAVTPQDWTFVDSGSFVVGIRATDKDGAVGPIESIVVTVDEVDPQVSLVEYGLVTALSELESEEYYVYAEFESGALDGPLGGGSDNVVSCTFDFQDGTVLTIPAGFDDLAGTYCNTTLGEAQAYHTYGDDDLDEVGRLFGAAADDLYAVTFTATDEDTTGSDFVDVFVPNDPPVLSMSGLNTNSPHPEGQFTALTLNWQEAGNEDSYSITINWGDSTVETFTNGPGDKTFNTSHLYTNPNTYTVNITVTDDDGGFFTTSTSITVTDIPLDITSVSTNAPVAENSSATIWVVADSPNPLEYSYDWNGDGLFTAASADVLASPDPFSSYTRTNDTEDLVGPPAGAVRVQVRVFDPLTSDEAFGFVDVVWTNEAPVITSATTAPVNEGSAASITVIADDPSPDDDAAGFTFAFDWDGNGVYESADDVSGTSPRTGSHTFTTPGTYPVSVRVIDEQGEFAETQVSVVVNNVNGNPVAVNDFVTTNEDTPIDIAVLANDTDPDDNTLSVSGVGAVTPAAAGTAVASNSSVLFTPALNYNGGPVTFNYTIGDGQSGSSTGTVTVTVTAVNDAPVANAQVVAPFNEDTSAIVTLTGTDVDGGALTYAIVGQPAHGTVSLSGAAATYTPVANFNGGDSFTFRVTDGAGASSAEAVVSLTVTAVNDAAAANADAISTDEDTPVVISVLANDSDVDGPALSISSATAGSINADGTITYTPAPNTNGVQTFDYTLTGGGTATVTVTVVPVNDAPVAVNDTDSAPEGQTTALSVVGNDSDVEDGLGNVTIVSVGSSTLAETSVDTANNQILYSVFPGTAGLVDNFLYVVEDANGAQSTASVSVTITNVNDFPNFNVVGFFPTPQSEGQGIFVGFNINDSADQGVSSTGFYKIEVDWENDSVVDEEEVVTSSGYHDFELFFDDNAVQTVRLIVTDEVLADGTPTVDSQSAEESAELQVLNVAPVISSITHTDGTQGGVAAEITALVTDASSVDMAAGFDRRFDWNLDGDFDDADEFLPAGGTQTGSHVYAEGGTYVVRVEVVDKDGGVVSTTITVEVDTKPIAVAQSVETDEDTSLPITLTGTDADGDTLTFDVTTIAGLTGSGADWTYTPAANVNGTVSFTFTVNDGQLTSDPATVTIQVNAINDTPVANNEDGLYTTAEDTALVVSNPALGLLANDTDVEGSSLTLIPVSDVNNGSIEVDADGTFTYTPAANFVGTDVFTYQVSDGTAVSNVAYASFEVTGVNDVPVAYGREVTTNEDTAITLEALGSDADGDALLISIDTAPANGSTSISVLDGSITYTPNADFHGDDSFIYELDDQNGGTTTAVVIVHVAPVNDAPVANDDSGTTAEDTALVLTVASLQANDTDVDTGDTLDLIAVTQGANGAVSFGGGNVTYVPAADFNGTDSFTYTVRDSGNLESTANVTITVNAANDLPVAAADLYEATEDQTLTVPVSGVLGNDTDVEGSALSTVLATGPTAAQGVLTLNANGSFTFVPTANFNGTASFTYRANDGTGNSTAAATVTINVAAVNDTPVAVDGTLTVPEDGSNTIALLPLASDVDAGDTEAISAVTNGANGTVTVNGAGVATYVAAPNFNGTDSFTWTVVDAAGAEATGTIAVTVTAANDAPTVAISDVAPNPGFEGGAITGTLTIADPNDGTGGPYTVTVSWGDGTPDVTFSAPAPGPYSGTHTYVDEGTGIYTLTVSVVDGALPAVVTTTQVAVQNVAPSIASVSATPDPVNEGSVVSISVTASDAGLADTLSYSFDFDGNGTYETIGSAAGVGTHTYAQSGDYAVPVRVRDDDGGEAVRFVVVHVADAPPAISSVVLSSNPINEGGSTTVTVTATDPANDPLSYSYDFDGDGLYEVEGGNVASHTYLDNPNPNAPITVGVKVTDDAGKFATGSAPLTVNNVAPNVAALGSRTTREGTLFLVSNTVTDPGADTFTWSLAGAPSGMTITNDGHIGWVPTWSQCGKPALGGTVYNITVTATDDDGAADATPGTLTLACTWIDDDGDGIGDTYELANGMDPTVNDALGDVDGDGVTNIDEFEYDTNGQHYPEATGPLSPVGGIEVNTADVTLVTTNTTDLDGDAKLYIFELYEDAGLSGTALFDNAGAPMVENTAGTTSVTVSAAVLSDDSTYYWRVRAKDDTGISGPWSAVQTFFYSPVNDPPSTPFLASPVDDDFVSSLTPVLVTDNAADPDDTALTYTFQVFDNPALTGTPVVSSGALPQGGFGNTSWLVSAPLSENTWYYWRVRATDNGAPGSQTTDSATSAFFVSLQNDDPAIPVVVSPANGIDVATLTPSLDVDGLSDPENQTLSVLFEIDSTPAFNSADYQVSGQVPEAAGAASWVPAALTENTTYWWRARAYDGYQHGEWVVASFFVNVTNDAPSIPVAQNPANGALINGDLVVLTVRNATDPEGDAVTYNFAIYTDALLTNECGTAGTGIAETTEETSFVPDCNFKNGRTYFWTSQAVDSFGLAGPVSQPNVFETIDVGGGSGCSVAMDSTQPGRDLLFLMAGLLGLVVIVRKRR